MTNSISSSSTSAFPNLISQKLDDLDFLLWRQKIELVIKSHERQRFIANQQIPLWFLTEVDRDAGVENPAYEAWEQQDQVLLAWLQSTLSTSFLSRIIGCVHSYEVWEWIHDYFHKQMQARARQLRTELLAMILEDKSMCEFLLRIKAISDALVLRTRNRELNVTVKKKEDHRALLIVIKRWRQLQKVE